MTPPPRALVERTAQAVAEALAAGDEEDAKIEILMAGICFRESTGWAATAAELDAFVAAVESEARAIYWQDRRCTRTTRLN
jgi:hypothetical protein